MEPQAVVDGFGVWVQLLVPLHVLVMHAVSVQVIDVPRQDPPEHASLYVHGFESSHPTAVRHCQMPPVFVQRYVVPPQVMVWHRVWVAELHVYTPPPVQIPSPPAAPQPAQN